MTKQKMTKRKLDEAMIADALIYLSKQQHHQEEQLVHQQKKLKVQEEYVMKRMSGILPIKSIHQFIFVSDPKIFSSKDFKKVKKYIEEIMPVTNKFTEFASKEACDVYCCCTNKEHNTGSHRCQCCNMGDQCHAKKCTSSGLCYSILGLHLCEKHKQVLLNLTLKDGDFLYLKNRRILRSMKFYRTSYIKKIP
jgi:hypothetical protein